MLWPPFIGIPILPRLALVRPTFSVYVVLRVYEILTIALGFSSVCSRGRKTLSLSSLRWCVFQLAVKGPTSWSLGSMFSSASSPHVADLHCISFFFFLSLAAFFSLTYFAFALLRARTPCLVSCLLFLFSPSSYRFSRVRRRNLTTRCGVDLSPHFFLKWIAASSIYLLDLSDNLVTICYRRVMYIYDCPGWAN